MEEFATRNVSGQSGTYLSFLDQSHLVGLCLFQRGNSTEQTMYSADINGLS